MTEYEKMISGKLYNARDAELTRMRRKARTCLDQLNRSTKSVQGGNGQKLFRKIFGKVGPGLWLQPPFYCDYGRNIELGEDVGINYNCVFLDVAPVRVGSFVLFGPGVQIYTAGHPLDWKMRRAGQEFGRPVRIGDLVWVGGGAILCPGVSVGDRSVIGAGAVVTRDVPADVVVAGSPARIIRRLKKKTGTRSLKIF